MLPMIAVVPVFTTASCMPWISMKENGLLFGTCICYTSANYKAVFAGLMNSWIC